MTTIYSGDTQEEMYGELEAPQKGAAIVMQRLRTGHEIFESQESRGQNELTQSVSHWLQSIMTPVSQSQKRVHVQIGEHIQIELSEK